MQQIYPPESARELDEAAVEALYRYPDPWLAVNFVSSVDGAVEVDGRSAALSTPPDRRVFALGSDLADVLLIGAGTAVAEEFHGVRPDYTTAERRHRNGLAPVPPIAVVSTGASLPADAPVITDVLVPTIVVTSASTTDRVRAGWTDAGAEVLVAGESTVDFAAAVAALRARGLRRIDAEGGPHLFASLLAADEVDELRLTISPFLVAGAAGRIAAGGDIAPMPFTLASVLVEDDTLLLRYLRP